MKDSLILGYLIIGFIYWFINMFVRCLPAKNDEQDGWFLSTLWFLGWPFCFLVLLVKWFIQFIIFLKNRV